MTATNSGDGKSTYECVACGWVYDETLGDETQNIPPGTAWADLPADWVCPVCGAGCDAFEKQLSPAKVAATPVIATVIVGSGLAGYTLAREIRKRSTDASIVVVTANGGEVYTKPMLSTAFGKGHSANDLIQKSAGALAEELGITIRTHTRVVAIDRSRQILHFDDGGETAYDRLVLAIGADPRVFPAPGSEVVDIQTVNELDDYRVWRAKIGTHARILQIGAGLIGCEFTNDLAAAGYDIDIVDRSPWPLARLLPKAIGDRLATALSALGARFHFGRTITRYEKRIDGFAAILDDGTEIGFDHALSAVGLTPRTALAHDAGLVTRAGIVVDNTLRTNDPRIFALGDCAETPAGLLSFIAPLLAEARVLAATLTGTETTLSLPALPVVVKTPALPVVVCPPPAGTDGSWRVETVDGGLTGVFSVGDRMTGFALAGSQTSRQGELAAMLPPVLAEPSAAPPTDGVYVCDACGWEYDPSTGDPEGGIPPGTAWVDIPDDWCCPVCGATKDGFTKK